MEFARKKLRFRLPSFSRGMLFALFTAMVTATTVLMVSAVGTPSQKYDLERQQLLLQFDLVRSAAVVARDLAMAEDGRAEIRQKLADITAKLATGSVDLNEDLSLDRQFRVFVARLHALSKGGKAQLASNDPRLRGITEAMDGALRQGLEAKSAELDILVSEAGKEAEKLVLMLIVIAFGLVAVAGTALLVRSEGSVGIQVATVPAQSDSNPDGLDNKALLSALDGLDQGVAVFDASDKLVFFTPRLDQVFSGVMMPTAGQQYEDFVRQILLSAGDSVDDEPGETFREDINERLSQRLSQAHGGTYKDFLRDGRCLEVSDYVTTSGGRIILVRDITKGEHRQAVQRLSDARTTAIVDTVFDGIIMINDEGEVETFNPAAENIFGYAAREVIGQNVSLLMPQGHSDAHDSYLRRYLDGGTPKVIGAITELQGRRKDGQLFPLEIAVDEVDATWILQERRRTPRRVFIATLRDITEQKALARQLQQSQKMEAIGTLAGGIAHDFNNILSIILGFTGLTLEDNRLDEDGRENLDTVLEAANRARDLVQQILAFSRKGDQEKLRVILQTVLADALKMLRSTIPANVEMRTEIDPRELAVMADPTQMHQVLMNLCTNAGQAMPRGGILEVKLQRVQIDGKTLEAYGMQGNGSCIRLMVRDTGIGMDAGTLERVFEPFYTTKPLGVGTGLGLSVVHGIIKEHGGHIFVESSPGAGATFTVLLPLAEPGEMAENVQIQQIPHGTGRILFVDDEPAVVRMADKMLTRLGYEFVGKDSSVEALRLFREQPGQFDLAITDHSMPEMTGDVLAVELRRIRNDIPIIICTGYSTAFTPEAAKGAGINGYVMKPSLATDLGRVVHEVLNGKNI
jgi:PAS domain S-box-containing protein